MSPTKAPAIAVDRSYVTSPAPSSASSRRTSLERTPLPSPAHSPRSPSPLSTTAATGGGPPLATTTTTSSRKPSGRNRSALLQFYGIDENGEAAPVVPEIDKDGLDTKAYVEKLVETAGLNELLKKENELLNDIRGFDGERKALVYDNYSKLITATDTIRKMRASMEPLTPTTSTLEPAISHIAQVSASLVETIHLPPPTETKKQEDPGRKKEIVRWALGAPRRIEGLREEGKREEAEAEFGRLQGVLDAWKGVKGADELRTKAREALVGMELS